MTGIDVSKNWLDVWDGSSRRYANSPEGISKLAEDTTGPYALEATNVYHIPVARHLHSKGHTVYVVSPLSLRRYAQSLLARSKTDSIDARLIAEYASARQSRLHAWSPLESNLSAIRILVNYARGLIRHRTANLNRLHSVSFAYPEHAAPLIEGIDAMNKAAEDIYQQALAIVFEDDLLSRWHDALTDIKGIGNRVALTILAYSGDMRRFTSARAYAAYTGLTPALKQSGQRESTAHISRLGPAQLREAYYIAARSAVRHEGPYRKWYEALLDRGKPKRLALTALARKLAVIAWHKTTGR